MKVLITGATGFVGRALTQRLQRDRHRVVAWVRDTDRARARLGPDLTLVPTEGGEPALAEALRGCDAVVNLAGDPLFSGRWTAAKKQAMVTSRVHLTQRLVRAMAQALPMPRVLVSASAIGYYGDRGDEPLHEASAPGTGYLPELCRRWEAAAHDAEELGVRVACLRIGIVLGADGGALSQMLPPFRLGLGGPMGAGRQFMSWIHLDDMVELVVSALEDERYRGAFDATAPDPVPNRDFARSLGAALGRPAFLPAPGPAVRLLLGEAAQVLLGGQKVLPERAQRLGFRFRHPCLAGALEEILSHERSVTIEPTASRPGATHHLHQEVRLEAPLEEVRAFFSRAENLGVVTPAWVGWEFLGQPPPEAKEGTELCYRIQLGPLPLSWRSVIAREEPGMFVDAQLAGPYRSWWHEHRFEADGEGTRMVDDVYYSLGWGPLGRLVHWLAVGPSLRGIFGYRRQAIQRRFPVTPRPAPRARVA